MMKNKKGFCVAPFRHSDFLSTGDVWQCCNGYWSDEQQRWVNAWITTGPSGNVLKNKWQEIWNGETAKKLRQSMHDGDMKYCDQNECNFLHRWNNETITEDVYDNGYFPIYDETTIHKLYNAKEINPTGGEKYKQIIEGKSFAVHPELVPSIYRSKPYLLQAIQKKEEALKKAQSKKGGRTRRSTRRGTRRA